MRAADFARLNEPYPEALEPTEDDARAAIGIKLLHWASLESEIFADFVEQQPHGIGWWAPDPGTSRRILIADQLSCCLASVADNMTEAALHWLEYLDASDRDSARLAHAVKMLPSGPVIDPPRPRSVTEQLAPDLVRMQQAGLIRAIASSLDCLAGVIIGVAALPHSILKADFKQARAVLARIDGAASAGAKAQADFAARLESAIVAAGPHGWLDWTLDLRNMLVHRGRRIELGQYLPITPVLLGPDGKPAPRARRVSHLPRDPGRSDIEVFIDTPWNMVLHEEGTRTLQGLMNSTVLLLETAAGHLLNLWQWRRAHPGDLRQPADQWKNGPSKQSTGFNGYAPGSLNLKPSIGMMHPITARRFHAAAVDDAARPQWATFD
ncbi:MAG: hypothetical protein LAQ30_11940 [Acidobacteriia bacterium]|nr:hypothetical protein [Terriglobia bacterium]